MEQLSADQQDLTDYFRSWLDYELARIFSHGLKKAAIETISAMIATISAMKSIHLLAM